MEISLTPCFTFLGRNTGFTWNDFGRVVMCMNTPAVWRSCVVDLQLCMLKLSIRDRHDVKVIFFLSRKVDAKCTY